MARLFVGLCQSAGMQMAEVRRTSPPPARKPAPAPRSSSHRQQSVPSAPPPREETRSAESDVSAGRPADDLFTHYVRKLIDGVPPLVIDPAMDPDALRLHAEVRALELDRIERLLQTMQ
jgi:hypothetical protein